MLHWYWLLCFLSFVGDQAQDFLVLALFDILKLSKGDHFILVILRDHLTPVPEMSDHESDDSTGQYTSNNSPGTSFSL